MDYKRDKWMIDYAVDHGLTLRQLVALKNSYDKMKEAIGK